MEGDRLLDDAVAAAAAAIDVAAAFDDERAPTRVILGLRSLSPLDGDKAESRWCNEDWVCCDSVLGAAEASEVTDPVDAFLKPENESDSRFLRVVAAVTVEGPLFWRAIGLLPEVSVALGDARTDSRLLVVALADFCGDITISASVSNIPNSVMSSFVAVKLGEGDMSGAVFAAASVAALALTRRVPAVAPFIVGEDVADVLPVMRGIFVGVSFVMDELNDEGGGILRESFNSFETCATDGDPAIVGS